MRSAGLIPEPIQQLQRIDAVDNLTATPAAPTVENSSFINVSGEAARVCDSGAPAQDPGPLIPPAKNSAFINVLVPGPDASNSTLPTLDSRPSPPIAENAAFTNVSPPELGNFEPRLRSQDSKPTSEPGSNSRPQTLDSHPASSDSPDP
jgi:hypothetical protein